MLIVKLTFSDLFLSPFPFPLGFVRFLRSFETICLHIVVCVSLSTLFLLVLDSVLALKWIEDCIYVSSRYPARVLHFKKIHIEISRHWHSQMHLILENFRLKIESKCVRVCVRTVKNAYDFNFGICLTWNEHSKHCYFDVRCSERNHIFILYVCCGKRHQIVAPKILAHTLVAAHPAHIAIVQRILQTFYIEYSQCHQLQTDFQNRKNAVKHKHVSVVLVRIYLACLFVRARKQHAAMVHCITRYTEESILHLAQWKEFPFISTAIVQNPICVHACMHCFCIPNCSYL